MGNNTRTGRGGMMWLVAIVAAVALLASGQVATGRDDDEGRIRFEVTFNPKDPVVDTRDPDGPLNITFGVNRDRVGPHPVPTESPWRDSRKFKDGDTAHLEVVIITNNPNPKLTCKITYRGKSDYNDQPRPKPGNKFNVLCSWPPPEPL